MVKTTRGGGILQGLPFYFTGSCVKGCFTEIGSPHLLAKGQKEIRLMYSKNNEAGSYQSRSVGIVKQHNRLLKDVIVSPSLLIFRFR